MSFWRYDVILVMAYLTDEISENAGTKGTLRLRK